MPPGDVHGGIEGLAIKRDGTVLQTVQAVPYLSKGLEIDVATALVAALTVERTGTPCGGFWGDNPAPSSWRVRTGPGYRE